MKTFLLILFMPAIAAFAFLALHAISRSRISFLLAVLTSTCTLFVWLWACWGLRNGIGPGTDPSKGMVALKDFSRLAWVPLMAWAASVLVAMALRRKRVP